MEPDPPPPPPETLIDRYQYLLLMLGCLVRTLPLELVIGARVWRRPGRLAAAVLPVAAAFVVWDLVAIDRGHWQFAAACRSCSRRVTRSQRFLARLITLRGIHSL